MEKPKPSDPQQLGVIRERFKICPSCGNFSVFSGGQNYCIVCGARLLLECPACREPILYPTAHFCPACGARLVESKSDTASGGEPVVSSKV